MQLRVPGEERLQDPSLGLDVEMKLVPDFLKEVIGKIGLFPESSIQISVNPEGKLLFKVNMMKMKQFLTLINQMKSTALTLEVVKTMQMPPIPLIF